MINKLNPCTNNLTLTECKSPNTNPLKVKQLEFPKIDCRGNCGFEKRGIGYQCVDGTACNKYIHPGDEFFDQIDMYYTYAKSKF